MGWRIYPEPMPWTSTIKEYPSSDTMRKVLFTVFKHWDRLLKAPLVRKRNVPYLTINDYPDLSYRGVVEGFYGTPWSHQVRMSLIDLYGKFKMNYYLYGPKDDHYHSCAQLETSIPGERGKKHQRTSRSLQPQQGWLCMGYSPGTRH